MNQVKSSGTVKFMNVMGVIMFVVFVYMMIANIVYLRTYAQSYTMSLGDVWQYALQYMISSSLQYLVYGILFIAAGKIIKLLQNCCVPQTAYGEEMACCCDEAGNNGIPDKEAAKEQSENDEAEPEEESNLGAEIAEMIEINVSEDATEETKAINVAEIKQRKRKKKK